MFRKTILVSLVILTFVFAALAQQRLVLIGGGKRPPEVLRKFAEFAGGERGKILIVTWASGEPQASFDAFKSDLEKVSRIRIENAPVKPLNEQTKRQFLEQLKTSTGVFFTGGDQNRITDVLRDEQLRQALHEARGDPRLVAVGEIGLDFFVAGTDAARQQRYYVEQLKIARDAGLPVIVHVRRSADALLAGLRRIEVAGGIAHAFNGSDVQAGAFVARGFALGFGGAMTFERALRIRHLAQSVPAHALVVAAKFRQQNFERYIAFELLVVSEKNFAHTACSDLP